MIRLAILLAALLVAPAAVQAQQWPAKPVRFVVPFPAGGTTDILARLVGQHLSETLGQQFVIENRAGAGGNVGTEAVAKADPDGHTILMATIGTHSINPSIYAKLPYDPVKDFAPVSLVALVANVLVVHPSVEAKNVQELIALSKRTPGKLNFGTPGNGTSGHLSGELFKSLTGADLTHIPYRGSAPMLQDLLAGQVQLSFDNLPSALPHIRAGALRALGVTTPERWPAAPELPTVAEQGVPGYNATAWFAVYAPARTPPAIVTRLSQEIDRGIKTPALAAKMREQGAEPVGGPPDELAAFMASELQKWAKVAKEAGAKVD
jgi:tripartite-type tricarboxylate transporter receptor subunit TctC